MAKGGGDDVHCSTDTEKPGMSVIPPPGLSALPVTLQWTMTPTTVAETGAEEDLTDKFVSKPHVERRQLVNYGDLMPSDSATSSESSAAEEAEDEPSTDSSSDDAEGILKTALTPIDMEVKGYDLTSPPENGSQFLLQVQYQRKQLPKVVSAKRSLVEQFIAATPADDTKKFQVLKMPASVAIPSAIQEFLPTQNWVSIIIHQFSNLYLKVLYWRSMMADGSTASLLPDGVSLPSVHEKDKWILFCFGTKLVNQIKSHPRERNGVKSSNNKAIATFFSDDVEINLLTGTEYNAPHCPSAVETVEATASVMKDLIISEPDKTNEENPEMTKAGEPTEAEKVEDDDDSSSSTSDSSDDVIVQPVQPPLLSILLSMPVTTVEDVLRMHVAWLKHYGWFHELQGKWIYALLACLEKPLPCAVIADIRDLVRVCCKVRNSVCESKVQASAVVVPKVETVNGNEAPEGDADETPSSSVQIGLDPKTGVTEQDDDPEIIRFKEFVNTLNLFVCLAANYFQQHDLADPVRV